MVPDRTLHGDEQHRRRATLGLFEALVLDHGTRVRSHGADIVFLDKAARKRLRREIGGERGMRVFDRYWNAYLVVADDGRIITTGRRTRRVKRP
ncbi:MAG: hypothetical protein JO264_07800 [Acidisphaera sp.]|nr:hypothetical protein [Acidisphaera sp.]